MEKNLIPAPIDNKNLMEDAFEDDCNVFGDFYYAKDHRFVGMRHLIGHAGIHEGAYVEAKWLYGSNEISIKILATNDSFEMVRDIIFDHYKETFKSWECEENRDLVVRFRSEGDTLYVSFFYDAS